jgi:L-asparaginase/Glu-tRNA(Gln) amidotransferase subunit D
MRHHTALKELKALKIPVVIATQAPNGISSFQVNASGAYLRQNELAIPSFDMSTEAQITKLGWLLTKKRNRTNSYEHLCEQMVNDIRGEINVVWETGA